MHNRMLCFVKWSKCTKRPSTRTSRTSFLQHRPPQPTSKVRTRVPLAISYTLTFFCFFVTSPRGCARAGPACQPRCRGDQRKRLRQDALRRTGHCDRPHLAVSASRGAEAGQAHSHPGEPAQVRASSPQGLSKFTPSDLLPSIISHCCTGGIRGCAPARGLQPRRQCSGQVRHDPRGTAHTELSLLIGHALSSFPLFPLSLLRAMRGVARIT